MLSGCLLVEAEAPTQVILIGGTSRIAGNALLVFLTTGVGSCRAELLLSGERATLVDEANVVMWRNCVGRGGGGHVSPDGCMVGISLVVSF